MKICVVTSHNRSRNYCVVVAKDGFMMVRHTGQTEFLYYHDTRGFIRERESFPACKANSFLKKKAGITLRQAMDKYPNARW